MSKFRYLIFVLVLPLMAYSVHKYYLSLTTVEYKEDQKTLQITMRIFIDDLQETINKTYQKEFEFSETIKDKTIDSLLSEYIIANFKVEIDNTNKNFTYLGKQFENDVIYLYLEILQLENFRAIAIKNTMLISLYPDQKNIIKLKVDDRKKTFVLTKKKDKDLLKL